MALRHGRHPQAEVHENVAEPYVLAELRLRLQAVPAALREAGALIADQAEQRVPGPGDVPGALLAIRRDPASRQRRVELDGCQSIRATRQNALREDPVDCQRIRIAALPVAREALGLPPDRVEQRVRLVELRLRAGVGR